MKHIKTYESFNNYQVNEGVFDFLRKIFNSFFINISDVYTQQSQKVFKDIEHQNNPKAVYDILKKFLVITKNTFVTDLNNAETLLKVRDAVYSNFISLYSAFTSASKKLSNNNISFENVFGDNPPKNFKKIFTQKDEKKRLDMFKGYTDTLIESLGSGINIKDFSSLKNPIGFDEKDTNNQSNDKQQEEIANNGEQNQNTEQKTENINITEEQIKNIKDLVISWFDSNIYKKINENIGNISKESEANNGNDIDKMVEDIKATKNKDGVKIMLQKIAALNDPKKYAEVRDKLVELGIVTKDEIKVF